MRSAGQELTCWFLPSTARRRSKALAKTDILYRPPKERKHMSLINILVVFSYVGLNLDVLLQNITVYQTRDSADVSLTGVTMRFFAVTILAVKFLLLDQSLLLIGQTILTVNVIIYLCFVFRYRIRKRRKQA